MKADEIGCHKEVIKWINNGRTHVRFATWEIRKDTNFSARSIRRVLDNLRKMQLVGKMPRGFNHKFWQATKAWDERAVDLDKLIHEYEFFVVGDNQTKMVSDE